MENRRYPGVVSFTAEQQSLFFGRNQDINRLYQLIRNRQKVLLYSKSGIGKSSLLQAGVVPKLQTDFLTVNVRFYLYDAKTAVSPVERLRQSIASLLTSAQTGDFDRMVTDSKTEKNLWYYFKKLQSVDNRKVVLVFDQFEELFSYPTAMRLLFKQQLYELLHEDVPQSMMQYLVATNQTDSFEKYDFLQTNMDVRTVFAIRFDYLSRINELADVFPDIQENYYELKALDATQARDAILKPATQTGNFASPAFQLEEQATAFIIDALTAHGQKAIETTQLQLVCTEIEDIAISKHKAGVKDIVIQKSEIPDFTGIFLCFYENSVAKLPDSKQPKAKEFIEDVLIRNGLRVSFDKLVCADYIDECDLNVLVNCHLLHSEPNSTGGESIELCHDTVIEPITQSRNARLEQKRIADAQHAASQKLRMRLRTTSYILLALLFVIIIISVFSVLLFRKNKDLEQLNESITGAYTELSQLTEIKTDSLEAINLLKQKTEASDWQRALQTNTEKAYTDFIGTYPQSAHKPEAEKKIADLQEQQAWKTATTANTCDSYKLYLDQYTTGKYKTEATTKRKQLNCEQDEPSTGKADFTDPTIGMKFKLVKGGTFKMGSPTSEKDRSDDETQHSVTVSDFYMGKYEVTQKQWRDIMGSDPSYNKNCDDCPVENVSWDMVQEFIKKLNDKTGQKYRLPTEAEWEYVCRAGTTTPFNTGNCLATTQTNYNGNYPYQSCSKGEYRQKPMTVGSYAPNAYELYDMHGNVYEWCSDWYGDYSTGAQTNPTGPASGSDRVLRGGSWYSGAQYCRSANRSDSTPSTRNIAFGFRLVRAF